MRPPELLASAAAAREPLSPLASGVADTGALGVADGDAPYDSDAVAVGDDGGGSAPTDCDAVGVAAAAERLAAGEVDGERPNESDAVADELSEGDVLIDADADGGSGLSDASIVPDTGKRD